MQSKVWNRNRKSDKTIQTVSLELDFLFLDKRTNTFRFERFSSGDSSMCCLIDQSSPTLPVLWLPDKPTFVYPVHDRFSLTTSILLPIHNHCPETLYVMSISKFSSLVPDSLEIEINGKLIYSKKNLGVDPDIDEIVEITKWGHRVI